MPSCAPRSFPFLSAAPSGSPRRAAQVDGLGALAGQSARWLILCAAFAAWLPSAAAAAESEPRVATLRVPEGGIQPQVAVDRSGAAHLIYFRGDPRHGDLFYVRLASGSREFGRPLPVNRHPASAIAIGNVRGAHIALGRKDRVHVAWMGSDQSEPKAPGDSTPMLYSRLNDQRTEFEAERNVIAAHVGLDGGGSLAADEQGNVYVVWHAPETDRTGEANRRVWVAQSSDDGRTFLPERAASKSGGCCACCGMRAFADRDGRLYILYRSAAETVHRDMYLLASQRGASEFSSNKIAEWQVPTCVMSTAALAQGPAGVLAAWETRGQVFFGAADERDGKMARLIAAPGESAERKHPVLAANQRGDVILVWTEGMGWNRGGAVAWQVFDKRGRPVAGGSGRRPGVPTWSLPAVFARSGGEFTVVY